MHLIQINHFIRRRKYPDSLFFRNTLFSKSSSNMLRSFTNIRLKNEDGIPSVIFHLIYPVCLRPSADPNGGYSSLWMYKSVCSNFRNIFYLVMLTELSFNTWGGWKVVVMIEKNYLSVVIKKKFLTNNSFTNFWSNEKYYEISLFQ